ncbi:MAG TPA: GGDEF domain-containing protein [Pseudomonadales bacterium]|nr:GGDEF domain-containing protein [Pseudomonadales bacterium]
MKFDLLNQLDRFLPADLLQSDDETRLMKGRVMTFLSLMYLFSLGSMVLVFTLLGLLGIYSLWSAVVSSIISCCIYGYELWYFRRGGDLFTAANIVMFTMVTATAAFIFLTGGYTSPVMMILLCTPTCAFLMEGKQAGILWTVAVGAIACFFMILDVEAITLPNIVEDKLFDYLCYSAWLYGFMIATSGIAFYGSLTKKLTVAANTERMQLKAKATYDALTGAFSRQAFRQRLPQWLKNQDGMLFAELEIEIRQFQQREQLEALLTNCVQTLRSMFGAKLSIARSSSACFQILLRSVPDANQAHAILQTLHNRLTGLIENEQADFTLGAVMTPHYTNVLEHILQTARAGILEAKTQGLPYILYTEADRPEFKYRLGVADYARYRYAELLAKQ